jgi:hypothetical protein
MKEYKVDDNTKLFKRSRSNNYYVAVKSYTQKNKYYRLSTKETELRSATAKAKQIALDIYKNETVGAVVVEKTFNFVAKAYIAHTKNRIEKNIATKIEAEYVRIVEDKFCKFFGAYNFNAITQSIIEEYVAQRKNKKISRRYIKSNGICFFLYILFLSAHPTNRKEIKANLTTFLLI